MKEVALKEENLPSLPEGAWGKSGVSTQDIVIPKLILMQGLSQFVKDRKAQSGDIFDNKTESVIGGPTKPIRAVPFFYNKTLNVYEVKESKKGKMLSKHPWDPKYEDLPWEEVEDGGGMVRNQPTHNFFLFMEADLEDPITLPFQISFGGTFYKKGKILASHFKESEMAGVSWARTIWEFGVGIEKNENGEWFTWSLKNTHEETPKVGLRRCYQWYQNCEKSMPKVHENDLTDSEGEDISFP